MGMDPRIWSTAKARPEDRVDPSEFWKDEPGRAEGYANIYVPRDIAYIEGTPFKWDKVLNPEIKEWLEERAGSRRAYGLDWYQNTEDYDWYVRGELTHNDNYVVQFCIRDLTVAMMFKLTYGGI